VHGGNGDGARVKPEICPKRGWRLGGDGPFGDVAWVQDVAVTPGELLADADLIRYTSRGLPRVDAVRPPDTIGV
jgi:hypothetical protein